MKRFLIIGGDSRQDYLQQYLENDGFPVMRYRGQEQAQPSLADAMEQANVILSPLPLTKNGTELFSAAEGEALPILAFLSCLKKGHILFGGNIPDQVKSRCRTEDIPVYDFMKMEDVALKNTVATAEGAIAEAIVLSPGALHHSSCLITGYGRCGETLARKLTALDVRVTAADRSKARLALAYSQGLRCMHLGTPFPFCSFSLSSFDVIFNTIPSLVLDDSALRTAKKDAVLLDLASAPGGIDLTACKKRGLRAKSCPGLPGLYCPKAAAKILYQAVTEHL